jgi:hypothetical protein
VPQHAQTDALVAELTCPACEMRSQRNAWQHLPSDLPCARPSLELLTRQNAALIVFEDAHWTDPSIKFLTK